MQLSIKTLGQYMLDMAAAVQSSTTQILDLSVGSVLRALLEANASVALWLQMLISDVMDASRAATARDQDLDSWMADFALERLPATVALGQATFSRLSVAGTALVPRGTRLRTSDGALTFLVVADGDHPNWDEPRDAFLFPPTDLAMTVPIRAEQAGTTGNVLSGSITLIASSLAGVDRVINGSPTAGGMDGEADGDLRSRFVEYINSRSKGTLEAVSFAIASVRQGIAFVIHENVDPNGDTHVGHFLVTIDDGSGSPTLDTLSAVANAVELVRPLSTTFSVHPPNLVPADVSLSVVVPGLSGSSANRVRASVAGAIEQHIARLGIGAELSLTRVAQVAYGASRDVTNVLGVQINGSSADLIPGPREVIKPGMVAVS